MIKSSCKSVPASERRYFGLGAVLCVALGCCSVAHAADQPPPVIGGLNAQGQLSQSFVYDTNPLLLTTNVRTLYGSVTSPEFVLSDTTPTAAINTDMRVDKNAFNRSNFNSTDVHAKAGFTDQMQRWGTGILGAVDYDTTRTSELSNYGLIVSPVRHLGASVTPQISYAPTATEKLAVSASYQRTQYANSIYTNYDVYSVTPSYQRDFDPMNKGTFSVQAQRYRTTSGVSGITDTMGPMVGWNRILTPELNAQASVGIQGARSYGVNYRPEPWILQYNFLAGLTYKGWSDKISLTGSRNEYPFGNGTEALLTGVLLAGTHEISPLFAISAGGGYQYADYQYSANGNLKTMTTGNVGASYHLTHHLDIAATYQYRYETLLGLTQKAQDNMGMINLVYRTDAQINKP